MGWLRVDHRPRIEFYVRHGLVRRAPSDVQLAALARQNAMNAGLVERLRYYAAHPRELLPMGKVPLQTNEEIYAGGLRPDNTSAERLAAPAPADRPDRLLAAAFEFPPLRFAVQTLFNPWTPIPTAGLRIPAHFLIAHLLHTPHPTGLWDIQVLHPDPGALDELERGIERCVAGRGARARIFRAMASRPKYYEHLARLVARVRVFDYPATPAGTDPTYDNLVHYLNAAAELPETR